MSLSDKRVQEPYIVVDGFKHSDVKQFIKDLKEGIRTMNVCSDGTNCDEDQYNFDIIDELAGKGLTEVSG